MNTNNEFDSMDEMLKLPDFHFDQNIPVQGPEDQAPEDQGPEDQAPEDQAPEAQGLEVQAQNETMQTQRATLVDLQALWKKNMDGLARDNIELWSNMEVIEQQNRMLDLQNANLRIKADQVDPNSGPLGMIMPFGVSHNNSALNSGPPGMIMPFRAPHNNFALIPYQQAAQAHARMQQQQQQPQLVLPSQINVASGEGADAAGSDAGGGDDAPGQGP